MQGSEGSNRVGIAGAIALGIAALLALALILDLGPFADEDLSEQEFVAAGDEICAEAHDRFLELQRTPPRTPGDAAELTRELTSVAEEELDAIADLPAPSSLDPDVERYLAARERGIELIRRGAEAAEQREAEAYERLQVELARSQPARQRLARQIGFTVCSRPLAGGG